MSQVIHTLLIEDNRIEARLAEHRLTSHSEISFEVYWADQLATGLERLSQGGIDVVLLDLNLPDSRGLETFIKVSQHSPDVPIVVLTGEHDESTGLLAVRQGAEDYLIKQQFAEDRLCRALQFAVARHRAKLEQISKSLRGSTGKLISFVGAKGGVGTTTVAINVAAALAERGKSVIYAELKPTFGSLAFSLHCEPSNDLDTLLAIETEKLQEVQISGALTQGPATMRILFGSRSRDCGQALDAPRTERILKGLSGIADFIILDLPDWPSAATSTAALMSQFVGLVTERDPLAVICGQAAIGQLESWGVSGGLIGAIVVGKNNLPLAMDPATIRSLLRCDIVRMIPPASAGCYKAYVDRVPLVLAQPDNEASEAYIEIARLLGDEGGLRSDVA